MTKFVISSGHGLKVRGASGYLDEVNEARLMVECIASDLRAAGAEVVTFHDDTSTTQNENLNRIVNFHNSQDRDLDISVHFNAYQTTSKPMGTECLYVTQEGLAAEVSYAIAQTAGFIDRGPKHRTDLFFLNSTDEPAILIEVCFVDSSADADIYQQNIDEISAAIASVLTDGGGAVVPPPLPDEEWPTLSKGSFGPDVVQLQMELNSDNDADLEVDGDFGTATDTAVRNYQASRNLVVDGIVGPNTWDALESDTPPYIPPDMPPPLTAHEQERICEIAMNGAIASYNWRDRGVAPSGYIKGFALSFANVYRKMLRDHPPSCHMAMARTDSDKDVLNVYRADFDKLGMDNSEAGGDTLRHLFALLLGLGMRESSGRHCEGRDMSADNVSADTAEAGLYQTSYNAHASSHHFDTVFDEYRGGAGADNPQGFINTFSENVSCSNGDWQSYGSGDGYQFQCMCKKQPAFAVETCAITLRNLCNHYGPINRHECELKQEASDMLAAVQEYVDRRVAHDWT